jgi:alpha-glucosidase
VSANGTSFTTVVQVRGNTAAVTTHPVNTTGRYVRLNVIGGEQDGGGTARIYELEAYSS